MNDDEKEIISELFYPTLKNKKNENLKLKLKIEKTLNNFLIKKITFFTKIEKKENIKNIFNNSKLNFDVIAKLEFNKTKNYEFQTLEEIKENKKLILNKENIKRSCPFCNLEFNLLEIKKHIKNEECLKTKIEIKILSNKKYKIEEKSLFVETKNVLNVRDLKKYIYSKINISVSKQQILYKEKPLKNKDFIIANSYYELKIKK